MTVNNLLSPPFPAYKIIIFVVAMVTAYKCSGTINYDYSVQSVAPPHAVPSTIARNFRWLKE